MLNFEVIVPLVAVVATTVALASGWMRHRERMAGLTGTRTPASAALPPEMEMRLARLEQGMGRLSALEQSVDAIAVEIERIGEGQRFLTRLLSDPRAPGLEGGDAPAAATAMRDRAGAR